MSKVFGIGWIKTGTTSLGSCLKYLGYNHCDGFYEISNKCVPHLFSGNYQPIFELARSKDSFEDLPWCSPGFYKLLDKEFPESKFILTIRHPNNWLRSFKQEYFENRKTLSEQFGPFTGLTQFVNATFDLSTDKSIIATYKKHNYDAQQYFQGRNNLLVVNWEKGDGWDEVCGFLNKPVPDKPFPHNNKTQ